MLGGDLRGGQRLCELAEHKRAASLFATLKEFSKSCRINIRQFGSFAASPAPHHPILWSGIRSSSHAAAGSGRLVLARSKAEQEGIGVFFAFFSGPVLEFLKKWGGNGSISISRPLRMCRLPASSDLLFSTLCLPLRSSRVSQDAGTVGAPSISHPGAIPAREHATVWKNFR